MPVKTPVKETTKKAQQTKGLQTSGLKPAKKVTWDDIEAGFERLQKLHEETEASFKKNRDETWKAIRETQQAHKETEKAIKETQKAVKETQKNVGGLNNSLGSIVERLLIPGLPKKFKKFGFNFHRIATYCYTDGVYAQIDGMLENGEQAIAVEVKTTLRQSDIDDHLVRMEKIQKYAYEHGDKRQFMGAMAAFNTDEATKSYALNKGLFVIEPKGEDVIVSKPETEPRIW